MDQLTTESECRNEEDQLSGCAELVMLLHIRREGGCREGEGEGGMDVKFSPTELDIRHG